MLILFFLLLFILLLFPEAAAQGSKNGLILWATVLVPSLLPFSILTSLIRQYMRGKPYHYLLLAAGILSGYPIGAKIAGELYADGSLSKKRALFFAGFTNNPSPMFILFFVTGNTLHMDSGKYLFYFLVLLSSLLGSLCFSLFTARRCSNTKKPVTRCAKEAPCYLPFSKVIDAEIASSALLLIKIGGYIMLFSIFAALLQKLPIVPYYWKLLLGSVLEITTGNAMISHAPVAANIKIILSLAATSFGGLSAAAQTNSVLQNTGLSLYHYLIMKLLSGLCALLLVVVLFW